MVYAFTCSLFTFRFVPVSFILLEVVSMSLLVHCSGLCPCMCLIPRLRSFCVCGCSMTVLVSEAAFVTLPVLLAVPMTVPVLWIRRCLYSSFTFTCDCAL